MPRQWPADQDPQGDEYFARLEFERRRTVLDERETQAAEEEPRRILSVVRGRCPEYGAELDQVVTEDTRRSRTQ